MNKKKDEKINGKQIEKEIMLVEFESKGWHGKKSSLSTWNISTARICTRKLRDQRSLLLSNIFKGQHKEMISIEIHEKSIFRWVRIEMIPKRLKYLYSDKNVDIF